MDKYSILNNVFGYDKYRSGQEFFVDTILEGRDVLGIMPTGAGKSVCYQVSALMMEGITLVISPLISLMKDQVSALVHSDVRAAYLNSSLTENQYSKALYNAEKGMYKIIYVAPERLNTPSFLRLAKTIKISMVTVDEAHCVSQWGQDFRPGYLEIPKFINELGYRPVISAFTATATTKVRDDIIRKLQLKNPSIKITGFDRPNLTFEVAYPDDKDAYLRYFIRCHKEAAGIVYCSTRKNVENVYEMLSEYGYSVGKYHAGMNIADRNKHQENFLFDRIKIIVATNAFGMGIDKSDVAFVIHYNLPASIENYYQEAGRAGRDGNDAKCILLYKKQDYHIQKFLIDKAEKQPEITDEEFEAFKENEKEKLKKMVFYCRSKDCLRNRILNYFGELTSDVCGKCSVCTGAMEESSDTAVPEKFSEFEEDTKAVKNYNKIKSRAKNMIEDLVELPLYTELKKLRSSISKQENVPAFVVFSDMTLKDMCRKLPRSEEEFLTVEGVGQAKLKKYGKDFIRVIRQFS